MARKGSVAILLLDQRKADVKRRAWWGEDFSPRQHVDPYLPSRSQFPFFSAHSTWLSKSISLTTSYTSLEMIVIVIVIHEKLAPLQQSRTYLPQIAAGLPGCSCSEVS
jgi:hypothetical protein